MTDSTTAKGWLKKSNFSNLGESPEQVSARIKAARIHTSLFPKKEIKTYSQWFKGEENDVANALSCDNDRFDNKLTLIMKSFAPRRFPLASKFFNCPKK
jgi:hypothetical protein